MGIHSLSASQMKFLSNLHNGLAVTISIVAVTVSIASCSIQTKELNLSAITTQLEKQANDLNAIITKNSDLEIEILKKKASFEVTQLLYDEFHNFGNYNIDVMSKLKFAANERKQTGKISPANLIQNSEYLLLYLNTFETVYEQCKRGIISFEDVRMNFEYLIGPTCNNEQVVDAIKNTGNGLKLLCSYFHPGSLLGSVANKTKDSCKPNT